MEEIHETGVAVEDYFSPEMKQKLAAAGEKLKSAIDFFDQALDLMMRGVQGEMHSRHKRLEHS